RVVHLGVRPRAHEQADDLVTLLLEQPGGYRAIHAPTHGQHDTGRHVLGPSLSQVCIAALTWHATWAIVANGGRRVAGRTAGPLRPVAWPGVPTPALVRRRRHRGGKAT